MRLPWKLDHRRAPRILSVEESTIILTIALSSLMAYKVLLLSRFTRSAIVQRNRTPKKF